MFFSTAVSTLGGGGGKKTNKNGKRKRVVARAIVKIMNHSGGAVGELYDIGWREYKIKNKK